jgi:hypothetical protein
MSNRLKADKNPNCQNLKPHPTKPINT